MADENIIIHIEWLIENKYISFTLSLKARIQYTTCLRNISILYFEINYILLQIQNIDSHCIDFFLQFSRFTVFKRFERSLTSQSKSNCLHTISNMYSSIYRKLGDIQDISYLRFFQMTGWFLKSSWPNHEWTYCQKWIYIITWMYVEYTTTKVFEFQGQINFKTIYYSESFNPCMFFEK